MKCISCEIEINPKWKHAIDINVCPFCGKHILEEHLKNLLAVLATTMENLQQYSQQVEDWLLSNYNYIKTDSPNLVNFLPTDFIKDLKKIEDDKSFEEKKNKKYITKVQTESGEEEVQVEKIQSEEKTNEFFKRAQAIRPNVEGEQNITDKTKRIKEVANQIRRGGAAAITSEAGANSFITPEMIENADPDAVAEMQALLSGNEVASSLGDINNGDEEMLHPAVEGMLNRANSKSNNYQNSADVAKLQEMHSRINHSRRAFEDGTNRGKGGFSRSGS